MTISGDSSVLNVSVVGAGIAGLTAAIALRRNGHHVQIFETSEIKTEIGAALTVPANAGLVLDHLGVSRENLKGVLFEGSMNFDPESGEGRSYPLAASAAQSPPLLCHRSDLYEELKRLAIGDGEGPPAKLRLGATVSGCDPEDGTITLSSGEVVYSDLVLGADGINSVIRTDILGSVQKAATSKWSCFRVVFDLATVGDIPELQWLTTGVTGVRTVMGKGESLRMLLTYPCRKGTLLNFAAFYTNSQTDSQDTAGGWIPTASREDIKAQFRDFHPKFMRILDLQTHSEILKWQLRLLPLLPTWIRGRAALLGDSAHGTFPFLAQGAAMAIEDAGAIGCLFPAGTTREDIPARLAAYQDIRKQRGEFVRTESAEQVSRIMQGGAPLLKLQELQAYLLDYDAIAVAQKCYEERFGDKSESK
ncbi:FAD/NAD(P)-binding domain-containing protein [Mycena leptocephala]|nr:FAD/NAD(P)-binding domain-containing protein [Mycena leptocephala]